MELNEFQDRVHSTAVYPGQGTKAGLEYVLFGALGELGELANKYKKILRKEANPFEDNNRYVLMDEAADAVWYISEVFKELGFTFEDASHYLLSKLKTRKTLGQLKDHA